MLSTSIGDLLLIPQFEETIPINFLPRSLTIDPSRVVKNYKWANDKTKRIDFAITCADDVQHYFERLTSDGIIWQVEKIGKGGFGTVLKVTRKDSETKKTEIRAIKVIPNFRMGLAEGIKTANLNGPYIVKIYNILMIESICCLELEYCEKGSLIDMTENVSLEIVQKMLFQTCEALLNMKQHNIVHSDVKPGNILIKPGYDIALCDFGMSLDAEGTISEQYKGATERYLAPEFGQTNGKFQPTFHSDLYALGVTFTEVSKKISKIDTTEKELREFSKTLEQLQSEDKREREAAFYEFALSRIELSLETSPVWENDLTMLSLIIDSNLDTNEKFTFKVGEKPSKDEKFILKYQLFEHANKKLFDEKEFVLKAVKLDGLSLKYAEKFQSDAQVVLTAVKQNGMALEYAQNFRTGKLEGKTDVEQNIIFEAVKSNPQALNIIDNDFKINREFILDCIKENGEVFEFVGDKLKKDRILALEAVSRNGMMLKYASEIFRNDLEIALSAVKQDGIALKYVSKSLLDSNQEITLEALKQDKHAERYLTDEMKLKFKEINLEKFRIFGN